MRNLQSFDHDHHSSMQHYSDDKRRDLPEKLYGALLCDRIVSSAALCLESGITIALEIECCAGKAAADTGHHN